MEKERVTEIDFVRIVCAIGIVVYHFWCHSICNRRLFYSFANGIWGDVIVTIFFAISGAVLYLNNSEVSNIILFYKKRWKSIFPDFYIVFLFFYIINVVKFRSFFYGPKSYTIILSVLGIDGYVMNYIPNYYLVGEWFLGALIILYICYPLLCKIMKKIPFLTLFLMIFLFLAVDSMESIPYENRFRNFFSCLISFYIGMLGAKYSNIVKNKYVVLVSFLVSIAFMRVPLPLSCGVQAHLFGYVLLVVLLRIGRMSFIKNIIKNFKGIGEFTYIIFLIQHMFILAVLNIINPDSLYRSCVMLMMTVCTIIVIAVLFVWSKKEFCDRLKMGLTQIKKLRETRDKHPH